MTTKKFRSRTGTPVRIALTSGHVCIIGSEWQDVREIFHSAAYAAGCVSDDMEVNREAKEVQDSGLLDVVQKDAELKSRVRTAIELAIDENNLDAFTKAGNPTAKYIRDELGETVPNHTISAVMASILEEGKEVPVKNPDEELRSDLT